MKNSFLFLSCFLLLQASCNQVVQEGSDALPEMTRAEANMYNKYYIRGEALYNSYCSNCHQSNRLGLGKLYPPVEDSDFMQNNFEATLCIMKNGYEGPITVNGVEYNGKMPPVGSISNLEIAEIATYLYNVGKTKRGIVSVKEVQQLTSQCR